jgi:hypothetical protein
MDQDKYTVIESNEIIDVYRISYGVLLVVKKYEHAGLYGHFYNSENNKGLLKRYKDIKKCYYTTRELITSYEVVPAGTIVYGYEAVRKIEDPAKFYFEVKTTGNCFGGTIDEIKVMNQTIIDLIEGYRNV